MASAATSRARLHRFAEKRHSPAHSEVPYGPVTKISYIYVCSKPNTFLVSKYLGLELEFFLLNIVQFSCR